MRFFSLARLAALVLPSVRAFAHSERGASMAEYALLLGAIALLATVDALRLGQTMRDGAVVAAAYIRSL